MRLPARPRSCASMSRSRAGFASRPSFQMRISARFEVCSAWRKSAERVSNAMLPSAFTTRHWKKQKPKVSYPVSQNIDSCWNRKSASSRSACMAKSRASRRRANSAGEKCRAMARESPVLTWSSCLGRARSGSKDVDDVPLRLRARPSSPISGVLWSAGIRPWRLMMATTSNRILDDLARLVTDAAGAAQGVRREVETVARTQIDRLLREMDVVTREEFEAVREMAVLAREENDKLAARLAALEAGRDKG